MSRYFNKEFISIYKPIGNWIDDIKYWVPKGKFHGETFLGESHQSANSVWFMNGLSVRDEIMGKADGFTTSDKCSSREEITDKEWITQKFEKSLHQGTLDALEKNGILLKDTNINVYNWLAGKSVCSWAPRASEQSIEFRHQLLAVFPLLPYLIQNGGIEYLQKFREFEQQVDGAKKLIPSLSKLLDVSPWAARKVMNIGFDDIFHSKDNAPSGCYSHNDHLMINERESVAGILSMLDYFEPNHAPENPNEWLLTRQIKSIGTNIYPYSYLESSDKEEQIVRSCIQSIRGDWDSIKTAQINQLSLKDIIEDLDAQIFEPVARVVQNENEHQKRFNLWNVSETIGRLIFSNRTLKQLIAINDWWHNNFRAVHAKLVENYPIDERPYICEWTALCENYTSAEEWTVEALTTDYSLKAEAEILEHCVDGYVNQCMYKETHILSISDRDGKKSSTFQIDEGLLDKFLYDSSKRNPIIQHRARNNSQPSDQDVKVLAEWLDRIRQSKIRVDFRELRNKRNERNEFLEKEASATRKLIEQSFPRNEPIYNALNTQALMMAIEIYKPILPSAIETLSLKSFPYLLQMLQDEDYSKTNVPDLFALLEQPETIEKLDARAIENLEKYQKALEEYEREEAEQERMMKQEQERMMKQEQERMMKQEQEQAEAEASEEVAVFKP